MKTSAVLGLCLAGCTLVAGCTSAAGPPAIELSPHPPLAITALVPPSQVVPGWSMDEEVREYPGRKLFDFIDGAGEVHMTYNFVTAATADYVNEKDQYVTVSIFQVATSKDAYGLNSYYSPRRGRPVEVGQDGKNIRGNYLFWKGPYYVSVEGDHLPEPDPAKEAFARWVAGRIPEEGSPPDLLALLPREGCKTDPPVFLHKPLILSGLSFQAVAIEPDALGLNERCDMVVASYEGRFALSVTRYPEEASAQSALEAYGDASVLVTRVGRYLVATTSASEPARSAFEDAVSRVKARVTE